MFLLKDIIDMAIQIENNGEKVYRRALEALSDLSMASCLRQLAEDEFRHSQWLSQLDIKTKATVNDPHVEKAGRDLLQKIIGDQSFSLADADFSNMEDTKALLTTAIEFEYDTALFYEMIRPFVQDRAVLHQLDKIIQEEQQHAQNLEQMLHDTPSTE
jgi:rubrerythrin